VGVGVGASVGSTIGDGVLTLGLELGASVGDLLGSLLGGMLATTIGESLGIRVGRLVGLPVGAFVGTNVGGYVDLLVGLIVGMLVEPSIRMGVTILDGVVDVVDRLGTFVELVWSELVGSSVGIFVGPGVIRGPKGSPIVGVAVGLGTRGLSVGACVGVTATTRSGAVGATVTFK